MHRHLLCSRCSRRLIENFWDMVDEETTQTFSSFRLTCDCGARIEVDPVPRPRWHKWPEALPLMAANQP
jgi:hypothetical protein